MLDALGCMTPGLVAAVGEAAQQRLQELARLAGTVTGQAREQWGQVDATREIDWDSRTAEMYRLGLDEKKPVAHQAGQRLEAAQAELVQAAEEVRQEFEALTGLLRSTEHRLQEAADQAGHGLEAFLHSDTAWEAVALLQHGPQLPVVLQYQQALAVAGGPR